PFHADAMPALRGQLFDVQAELRWRCFARLVTQASRGVREHSRAVSHLGSRFFLRAVTNVGKFHLAADQSLRNRVHQVISSLHRFTVHAGDHVAALQSGLLRRATRLDAFDYHAVRSTQRFKGYRICARLLLEADADGPARHAPLLADLVVNVNGRSGRQRKAHAFIPTPARDDCGVDPDDFAGQIHQRPAGISRIDGGIGLQDSLALVPDPAAALGADDDRGQWRLQSDGAAMRVDPATYC